MLKKGGKRSRPRLDTEFLALSVLFIILGVSGIVLFIGPRTEDSCYCPIPTPEPGAMQGTAGVVLVFGILFLPIGILRGGAPSFGRKGPRQARAPMERTEKEVIVPTVSSASSYGLGVIFLIIGLDFIIIPGLLVFYTPLVTIAGAGLSALGIILIYIGSRTKGQT